MSSSARSLIAVGGLLIMLGGCEHTLGDKDATKFGEPNRMTMAAQVVNPDPQYDQPMTGSGDSAAQAVERWRTDAVKKPDKVKSTQIKGGGGGSGS